MGIFLKKLLAWFFSKAFLLIIIWVIGIAIATTYLVGKSYLNELPDKRERILAKKQEILQEIKNLEGDYQNVRASLKSLEGEIQKKVKDIKKSKKRIDYIQTKLAKLESFLQKIYYYANVIWSKESKEKAKATEEEIQQLKDDKKTQSQQVSELENSQKKLEQKLKKLSSYAEEKINELNQKKIQHNKNISKLDEKVATIDKLIENRNYIWQRVIFWIERGFKYSFWSLIAITASVIFLPIIFKLILYYVVAPLSYLSSPIIIRPSENKNPPQKVKVTESVVAAGLKLKPGETALIQHKFYQASEEDLAKRTRFLFNWRFPILSLACGLYEMTEVKNQNSSAENFAKISRSITLSSQDNSEIEISVVDIPAGGSFVCRPSFLLGIVFWQKPKVLSHWRIFNLQSWLTMQFRFFEFVGPMKLILWANRGVRAEKIKSHLNNKNISKRTNQHSTIGFSPHLAYKSIRAETFWSYFRDKNSLYDDIFSGKNGIFLCQQVPKREIKATATNILSKITDALLKVIGF